MYHIRGWQRVRDELETDQMLMSQSWWGYQLGGEASFIRLM